MRVTEDSISASYLNNVNKTRERISQLQSQLASGKRVLKPSDDPQATDSILRLNTALGRNEGFQNTLQDGLSMVDATSSALESFANILTSVKETVVQARNGSRIDVLGTFADRIDQFLSETVDLANTKFNGKYIFGGTQTLTKPFTLAPDRSTVTANPVGITGNIEYMVAESFRMKVNIDGQEAFQGTTFFNQLIQLRDDMRNGLPPTTAQLDQVDAALDHVLSKASKTGSIAQSLDNLLVQLEAQRVNLLELLSNQQDTDIAEAIMKLKHSELMLDAAINTGARIMPKSLLDFLR